MVPSKEKPAHVSFRTGDKAKAISDNPNSAAVNLESFSHALSNFRETSEVLIELLDGLSAVHPFVGGEKCEYEYTKRSNHAVAVMPFKIALSFEISWQDNGKKVLALMETIKDTMRVLLACVHVLAFSQ